MARYRVVAGRHYDEKNKIYNTGDIVECNHDLVAQHGKTKFELVPEPVPLAPATPAVEAAVQRGLEAITPPPLGTDVTADFPTADEKDLRVYKKGKAYFVTRADAIAEALNEEPLANKGSVVDFIGEYGAKAADA